MRDRLVAAKAQALRRHELQRRQLAPFRFIVVAIVLAAALTSRPSASMSGRGLAITASLVVFGMGTLLWPLDWRRTNEAARLIEVLVIAASSVALAALQPRGVSELPASAVVFMAGSGLSPRLALGAGLATTAGVGIALAPAVSGATVVAAVLLCAVLGFTASLVRRFRLGQDRTELLLAELEDARDEQARSAALAERASIARELHDVLAHSLSGLSLQLEGARQLALKDGASERLQETIDSAAALAKQGLVEARGAVNALRHEEPMSLGQIPALVDHFRNDLGLDVEFAQHGTDRPIAPAVSVALYRAATEALTNVTRHSLGARTRVELAWEEHGIRLSVVDEGGSGTLVSEGSGWGLVGMRERVSLVGGHVVAGPVGDGWAVVVTVPA